MILVAVVLKVLSQVPGIGRIEMRASARRKRQKRTRMIREHGREMNRSFCAACRRWLVG